MSISSRLYNLIMPKPPHKKSENIELDDYIKSGGRFIKVFDLLEHSIKHKNIDDFNKYFINDYLNKINNHGKTLLHLAVENEWYSLVQRLKYYGAENKSDYNGNTPLHIAVHKGNLELAKLVYNKESDLGIYNKDGNLPIHLVAQSKALDILKYFDKILHANMELAGGKGNNIAHFAVINNDIDMLIYIIERKGVNLKQYSNDNKTPWLLARDLKYNNVKKFLTDLLNDDDYVYYLPHEDRIEHFYGSNKDNNCIIA